MIHLIHSLKHLFAGVAGPALLILLACSIAKGQTEAEPEQDQEQIPQKRLKRRPPDRERWDPGFEELHCQLEEWLRELEEEHLFEPGLNAPAAPDGPDVLEGFSRQKMQSLRTDEHGTVRYELELDEEGGVKAKVSREPSQGEPSEEFFEAESMAAFRQAHPEIARQFDTKRPRLFGGWPGSGRLEWRHRPQFPRAPSPFRGLWPRRPDFPDFPKQRDNRFAGPKLGVQVDLLEWDHPLRSHVALDEGLGMLVVSVSPGSLADKLDLRKHDILIKVAGHEVGAPEDVRRALEKAELDRLSVTVIRQGREIELREQI